MNDGLQLATLVAALGCGVTAGAFFAFSVFVMKALDHLPPSQGAAAMQSINVEAPTPLFMLALFGSGAMCVGLAISSFFRWGETGAIYHLTGSVIYVIGTVLLTAVYHIPRNDALAALDPNTAEAASYWKTYVSDWTLWNHGRTATSLAAAALFTVALIAD